MRFLLFIYLLLYFSCSNKEEVTSQVQKKKDTINPVKNFEDTFCTGYTTIRPKVDFLFLWENSQSQNFLGEEAKKALANTINMMAPRFDYHIYLAPLIPTSSDSSFLMVDNITDLDLSIQNKVYPSDSVSRISLFSQIQQGKGKRELGIQRTINILNSNISNGIFRKNVYTVIVLISNGDDTAYIEIENSPSGKEKYQFSKIKELEEIKQKLNTDYFRFFSLVSHHNSDSPLSNCKNVGFTRGDSYINISQHFYNQLPDTYKNFNSMTNQDSIDICGKDFQSIFNAINNSIQDTVLAHVYNYWPISTLEELDIDFSKIRVFKNNGQELLENTENGFEYVGHKKLQATRIYPSIGEFKSGHMIKLNGSGKVTFPECLVIKTQEPAQIYGYFVLSKKPKINSIKIKKNNKEIPSSSWQYLGHNLNINVLIKSFDSHEESKEKSNKSGYVIKLLKDAIYSNNDKIEVSFLPESVN